MVLDTLQNKADNKTFYGIEKIDPTCFDSAVKHHSVTPKVSANAPMHMLCLLKSGATITWICLRVMGREEISSSPSSYHHKL